MKKIKNTEKETRDSTKRKKIEKALQESEERFKQVAENAREWIWEVNTDGLYTYASPVVERILGYKPEKIVGKKHFYDLFIPEVRKELKEAAFKTFAKKEPFREFVNTNLHKNGNIVILETSGTPILDKKGNLLGYRGADTDITEREKAREALRKSEERFHLVTRATNDAVWDWDLLTNKVWWNDAVRTLFGYSVYDVRPDADWWKENIHPEDRERVVSGIHAVIDSGEYSWSDEYRFRCKDNSYAIIFDRGFIIHHDKTRKSIRMIGSMMDITERKKAEEALRKAQEELEIRVKKRTAEFAKTNEELQESEKELKKKIDELEQINKLTVGRELEMMKMKKRIEELERKKPKKEIK